MATRVMELLQCDGICGNASTTSARFARLLDGWTTVNSKLDMDGPPDHDLCPKCSIEILLVKWIQMVHGLPSCGWALANGAETVFTFNLWTSEMADEYRRLSSTAVYLGTWRSR